MPIRKPSYSVGSVSKNQQMAEGNLGRRASNTFELVGGEDGDRLVLGRSVHLGKNFLGEGLLYSILG
jgi:hypothetical protein